MIKRSLSRNPRSKGIKAKHVLQICVLLGICFWLVYQVKRSHDKKNEFDEKDVKVPMRGQVDDDVPKLGRKDLHPLVQEVTKNEKHEEDEEEETVLEEAVNEEENKHVEEKETSDHEKQEHEEGTNHEEVARKEENKHEEEEQEEEIKSEEMEDDGRGRRDDEIDEHDQGKMEGEDNRDEDFIDEENEREDHEENGSESTEGEGKEAQVNYETSSEDEDHNEGDWNVHEAQEEHYKADDASSEVTHDTENINREPEKGSSENSDEKSAKNDLYEENNSNNMEEIIGGHNNSTIQLGLVEMAEEGHPVNATASEKKDNVIILSNNEDKSPTNTTFTSLSNDQPEPSNATSTETNLESLNNSADGATEISSSYQRNEIVIMSDSTPAQNTAVDGATTGEISNPETTQLEQDRSDSKQSGQNSAIPSKTQSAGIIDKDSLNSTSNSESDAAGRTMKPGVAAETEVKSGSSTTEQTKDVSHNENSDANNESGGTDEISDSSTSNGTGDEVIQDPIDTSNSSISQDTKDARVDLGTLLENGTEGVNSIDAAAE